jgi:hypothetical protein
MLLRILVHRLGAVDPEVEARIQKAPSEETLRIWAEEATMVVDAEDARRLVEKIRNAPLAA